MKFAFHRYDHLPLLSWCAELSKGERIVKVLHGPWVETEAQFFVEGVWDGAYELGGFDSSSVFMGSGGKLTDTGVVFSTPCHSLERLHLVQAGRTLIISNSLPFLLQRSGLHLDVRYPDYQQDLWSIHCGLDRAISLVPTAEGCSVRLLYHRNIEINEILEMREEEKEEPGLWPDFQSYMHYLRNGLSGIKRNASAQQRKVHYELLSTISSGYDSAACAALAKEIGCEDAVTFQDGTARNPRWASSDSGSIVGSTLGMKVEECSLDPSRAVSLVAKSEIAACGDAADLKLSALEDRLRGKIFFTGTYGDTIWGRTTPDPGSKLVRRNPYGTSLGEFRLRVGCLHVVIPFFGATRCSEVVRISNSAEMEPWKLQTDYDRPIPRRILEEKGVSRESFGQHKIFSSASLCYQRKSPPDFDQFCRKHRSSQSRSIRAARAVVAVLQGIARFLNRLFLKLRLPMFLPVLYHHKRVHSGRRMLVVQWGNTALRDRYKVL
jgi:hypothetical protein